MTKVTQYGILYESRAIRTETRFQTFEEREAQYITRSIGCSRISRVVQGMVVDSSLPEEPDSYFGFNQFISGEEIEGRIDWSENTAERITHDLAHVMDSVSKKMKKGQNLQVEGRYLLFIS